MNLRRILPPIAIIPGLIIFLVLPLASPGADAAALLSVSIEGLRGEPLKNVQAYLGPEPDTQAQRTGYVIAAQRRAERALNALGYYQPLVLQQLDRSSEPWKLRLQIEAGAPVLLADVDVQLLGEATTDEAFQALMERQPLATGDVLHHGTYERFKADLLRLAQQRGYFESQLVANRVAVDVDDNTAQLTLHFDSGPRYTLGAVATDEFPLNSDVLAPLMQLQSGQPFDVLALQRQQNLLQGTGYFYAVLVTPLPPEPASRTVAVQISLTEAVRHTVGLGLGYTTDIDERISVTWRTPRINRYGHRQETRIEYSPIRPSGRMTYSIPLSHPSDDILQLRLRLENDEFGSLRSDQREAGLRREWLWRGWVASVGARYLEESWDVVGQDFDNRYLLPGVTLSHVLREGNSVDPAWGFSQLYTVEAAGADLGSDIDLLRLYANWRWVVSPLPRHRLVTRLEAGAVEFSQGRRGDLAPSLSFFAGGLNSIRGYDYQSLGPTIEVDRDDGRQRDFVLGGDRLLVASLEHQYYVTPKWRSALFVDAGNAFNSGDSGDFEPEVGIGAGVHYLSPVGAIRAELGYSVSRDDPSFRVHIQVGAEF